MSPLVVEAICDVLLGVCAGAMLIPLVFVWALRRTDASAEAELARLAHERRVFAHVELVPIDLAAAQRERLAQRHASVEALDSSMRAAARFGCRVPPPLAGDLGFVSR